MRRITPLTYQILVALADEDRHGYGIIKEIEDRSGSTSVPSTGALYLALQRMEGEGLIEATTERPSEGDDARRRYYQISDNGRVLAQEESRRLATLVDTARSKNLLVEGKA